MGFLAPPPLRPAPWHLGAQNSRHTSVTVNLLTPPQPTWHICALVGREHQSASMNHTPHTKPTHPYLHRPNCICQCISSCRQAPCTKIPARLPSRHLDASSTARLTILCTHHEPHSQTPRTFRLHHPFRSAAPRPRVIRVHKTPGSRARWAPMNPVWLRGDDSGTTYLCRSTSGFSTGLGEPGVAGVRNGEFPADPRLGAGENRLAL